jgi:hypothetical protein
MVLNHYFTLVDEAFPQKTALLERGFKFTGPQKHKGQGTSVEFIFFPKNYIEFLWIDDLEASKNNLLKLHMRTHEDVCKYGFCFTGDLQEKYSKDFIRYTPPYSPNSKILILEESIDDLSMPLIFMDARSKDPKDSEPQNNKKIPMDALNPQELFFLPKDISDYNIPEYFRPLIKTNCN